MNKQRKVVITITYNEMGIIIDTKAEEVTQPNLQPTCNKLAIDTISRKAALDALEWKWAGKAAFDAIKALPSAQPERKRGQWNITDAYPHNVYCSECHTRFAQTHWAVWEDGSLPRNFCPYCGADMRKDDHE